MKSLTEKRKMIHDWIETADEDEVDMLLGKILGKEPDPYQQKLNEELNLRRQKHFEGTSESFTVNEVNEKLVHLRSKYDI
jgi:hypothetical protein